MRSWYSICALNEGAEILIYDEIGAYGVSAKSFLADLGELAPNAPLELRLNSPGGSVFDAVAIYNALKRHEGTVTVTIDGIAASAASYIAMAGDEIIMPENAFLMIHDPSGVVMGTAADMRSMAEALEKIARSLVRGYAAKSGRPEEGIAALMAAETWLDAADALAQGFADRLIEPVRIAAQFDIGRFRNAPPELAEVVEAEAGTAGGNDDATTGEPDQTSGDEEAGREAAAPEAPPVSAAPPDPVAIRASAIAHARAVVDLCRLAGLPQMAGRFLEQDASIDEVRMTLLAAKAEAEPEIAAHHPQPGRTTTARPWGEIVARTFRLKG